MVDKNQSGDPNKKGKVDQQPSFWRSLSKKRWALPAIYVTAAAIILGIMVWTTQGDDNAEPVGDNDFGLTTYDGTNDSVNDSEEASVPANSPAEAMQWPVDSKTMQVVVPFYDQDASEEQKLTAMLQIDESTFMPSTGISIVTDTEEFEVSAAMSGVVTRVDQPPYVGVVVEITHADGLKTVYQSLKDVQVQEGQEVMKGDVIAAAGRSESQKDLGAHVHFEVYQNDVPVNPEKWLKQ
ncbi:M23 family metallopeptidase [Longirhabdus pacifica]|uniref:M23 family metallopeptidase n=1 Tax=Longirhabdus pacifica TaxID=2305227 RepID=UPI001008FDC5|nr:M23 family metallopeptidase [Longirhabdus pacifica]